MAARGCERGPLAEVSPDNFPVSCSRQGRTGPTQPTPCRGSFEGTFDKAARWPVRPGTAYLGQTCHVFGLPCAQLWSPREAQSHLNGAHGRPLKAERGCSRANMLCHELAPALHVPPPESPVAKG